jgi:hypothetical protein
VKLAPLESKPMIESTQSFFCLTAAEFAQQCEAVNAIPRLCTVAEANDPTATGLRAWPSGLLPWGEGGAVHVLAWPDGKCMVSEAIWAALGGVLG